MATSLNNNAIETENLSQKLDTSALEKGLNEILIPDRKNSPCRTSDSEISVGSNSLSQSSQQSEPVFNRRPSFQLSLNSADIQNCEQIVPSGDEKHNVRRQHRGSEWEILEGLKDGKICETKPEKLDGYLLKKRKWPLKGWHKRYFLLDKGILTYTKTTNEMARGKILGSVDVGLSVISLKSQRRRIDIDAEEQIYHLKVKNQTQYQQWVSELRHHRLYRQHEISFGTKEAPKITTQVEDVPVPFPVSYTPPVSSIYDGSAWQSSRHSLVRRPISQQSRVAAWILDSSAIDQGSKDLSSLQDKIYQLETILQQLELKTNVDGHSEVPEKESTVKKERKRFHLKKRKSQKQSNSSNQSASSKGTELSKQNVAIIVSKDASNDSFNSTENIPELSDSLSHDRGTGDSGLPISEMAHLSCSHPSLESSQDVIRPRSLSDSSSFMSSPPEPSSSSNQNSLSKYREEFVLLAKEVHSGLRSAARSLQTERERLKQVLEADSVPSNSKSGALITSLRNSLNQTIQQNKDLKAKLQEIHNITDVSNIAPPVGTQAGDNDEPTLIHQSLQPSLSYESSSVLSESEFLDAAENFSNCSTSSEESLSEECGSFLSDVSDEGTEYTPTIPSATEEPSTQSCTVGRRSKLPAPKPDTGDFSLSTLLYKNIGKDLSKISMPVTLNEPLCVLQRLCEELEYCELLDKASETTDKYERMVFIAAFAVSAYNSSHHRAGHKPFNPLLGETFECIREDRGFKFVAEQVSHHPPISVCHAESKNFIFQQDMSAKTKFWGKSMEILPLGRVHVYLPKTNDHYQWNKVTTCVHNLFSGQRWGDQYGEMTITEESGDVSCKLTFVKASYWSKKRHEVQGTVMSRDGKVVYNLCGKWTEAFYCGVDRNQKCIWRPGTMPEDSELYYGFTRFAIELNELDPELEKLLPPTDSRFRPDQRLLEEGNVSGAETSKQQIEQAQRDRRKQREELGIEYNPMWFTKVATDDGKEEWVFNHKYWDVRKTPGFSNMSFPEKLF